MFIFRFSSRNDEAVDSPRIGATHPYLRNISQGRSVLRPDHNRTIGEVISEIYPWPSSCLLNRVSSSFALNRAGVQLLGPVVRFLKLCPAPCFGCPAPCFSCPAPGVRLHTSVVRRQVSGSMLQLSGARCPAWCAGCTASLSSTGGLYFCRFLRSYNGRHTFIKFVFSGRTTKRGLGQTPKPLRKKKLVSSKEKSYEKGLGGGVPGYRFHWLQ